MLSSINCLACNGNSFFLVFFILITSILYYLHRGYMGFPGDSVGICLLMKETQEMWFRSLSWEDSLDEGMATHSNILAWEIPWTEETSGYNPWGHSTEATEQACMHTVKTKIIQSSSSTLIENYISVDRFKKLLSVLQFNIGNIVSILVLWWNLSTPLWTVFYVWDIRFQTFKFACTLSVPDP